MSQQIGQSLSNYIGKLLEYGDKNNSNFMHPNMRIRMPLDVRKSLKKSTGMKKTSGESIKVFFKYEKLRPFCYLCGIMVYIEELWDYLFIMGDDDGHRHWSAEIWAELRPTTTGVSATRYLRSGKKVTNTMGAKTETPMANQCNNNHKAQSSINSNVQEDQHVYLITKLFKNLKLLNPQSSHQSHHDGGW